MIRVWRIPFSTNVERVALALGHKGVDAEWIDVDPVDRTPVREVSGQDLVPVLEEDGRIVHDSTAILEYLEARYTDPPLYPRDEARRAEATLLIDWFNRVWKRPPNAIADELELPEPDFERIAEWSAEMRTALDRFEALLAGRDYLFGDFGVADCIAFPFLKYAVFGLPADDDEVFHQVLVDHMPLDGSYPRLTAWVRRVNEHPQA
jgi:glutathione S-transferase